MMKRNGSKTAPLTAPDYEDVAGNGLLHRRAFLRGGGALAAAFTDYTLTDVAAAQQLTDDAWSKTRGLGFPLRCASVYEKTSQHP